MKKKRWLGLVLALGLTVLMAVPALAAVLATPAVVHPELPLLVDLPVLGLNMQPDNNTFYASGRHWVFYLEDEPLDTSNFVYRSAISGGSWSGPTTVVASVGLYGPEAAVWYDEPTNTVHYARHHMADPDEVRYRMGTPNADGTITWAAVEQIVAQTPADLVTWRTTIAVDENGYPWVAWIDTDGTNTEGNVYVESSSTKDGTWTEDVSQDFGVGGTFTDNTGTATGSPVALEPGANTPTITVAGTFDVYLPVGNSGTATTGDWVVTGSPKALVPGVNTITVEGGGGPGTITIDTVLEHHAWFVSITPLNSGADVELVEVNYSYEDQTGGVGDGDVAVLSQIYDNTGAGSWGGDEAAVAYGDMNDTRTDAFCVFSCLGVTSIVYTDPLGDVYYRARDSVSEDTWVESSAAEEIKEAGITLYIPTISGYEAAAPAMDLIVIVHDEIALLYSIYDNVGDEWGEWVVIWQVPDTDNDVISRHVATYQAFSPLGFAWQYTDDSDTPDTDDLMYWWIDNSNDTLGYYADTTIDWGGWSLVGILPYIFVAIGILGAAAFLVGGAPIVAVITLVITIVVTAVGAGIIQALIP